MLKTLEEKLNNAVTEAIRKVVNEIGRSDNSFFDNVFDLSKIPESELKRQHYDISLIYAKPGFGSRLFKNKKCSYITENDERVTSVDEVIDELKLKYNFADWQIKSYERGHDIQFCICIANFKNAIKIISDDMSKMGYFLSSNTTLTDSLGQKWEKMHFEPLYQVNESDEILSNGDLYHLTPLYNIKDIMENGLVPKSENKEFNYPNRIFLFIGNTPMNWIKKLGKILCDSNKNPKNNGEYVLLKVDSESLRNGHELHYDPNFKYGVFTEKIIPKEAITLYTKFNFLSHENI